MHLPAQPQDGNTVSGSSRSDRPDAGLGEPVIEAVGATHPGRIRDRNEDAFEIDHLLGLAVIADGLGGYQAGHIAAKTAVAEVRRHMRAASLSNPGRPERAATPGPMSGPLAEAVQHANKTICAMARDIEVFSGMKTTLAAVLVGRQSVIVAHVGDSRVYRLRAGNLERLTEDHSLAAEYLRAQGPKADMEIARQGFSKLTRCLGKWPEVRVTMLVDKHIPGDVYLLCTDGLWGLLDEWAMVDVILSASDLHQAVEQLIDLANDVGGSDNITAVLVRPAVDESTNPVFREAPGKSDNP